MWKRVRERAHREALAAVALCAAAGFADAVGYLNAGVFPANMTGNTVLASLAVARHEWTAALDRSVALGWFFGGAVVGRLLLRLGHHRPGLALFCEAIVISAAAFVDPRHAISIWMIAAAMGIQATAMTKFRGVAVSTVVITSTMARLAESLTDLLLSPFRVKAGSHGAPAGLLLTTWLCYGLGAFIAALLLPLTNWPLLVPALIVAGVGALLSFSDRGAKH